MAFVFVMPILFFFYFGKLILILHSPSMSMSVRSIKGVFSKFSQKMKRVCLRNLVGVCVSFIREETEVLGRGVRGMKCEKEAGCWRLLPLQGNNGNPARTSKKGPPVVSSNAQTLPPALERMATATLT